MAALVMMLLTVFAWWAPQSGLGRLMSRAVADAVRWLSGIRPVTIIAFLVLVGAFAALIAFARFEGLMLTAMAAPEALTWFLAIDVGAAVEVLAVAWLAATRGGIQRIAAAVRRVARRMGRMAGSRRTPRPIRRRRAAPPANDDEPAPTWAAAFDRVAA